MMASISVRMRWVLNGALGLPGQVLDQGELFDPVLLGFTEKVLHDVEREVLWQPDHARSLLSDSG